MAEVTDTGVYRLKDPTDDRSDVIAAFKTSDNKFIQQMALVDENGNQIAVSGTPLFVTITGDSVVTLDANTINELTGSTTNVTIDEVSIDSITSNLESVDLNNDTITQLTGSVINVGVTGVPTVALNDDSLGTITGSGSTVKILGDNDTHIGTTANPIDVNIRSLLGVAQTAFGRLRTANVYTLADIINRYDIDNRIWATGSVNSAVVSHLPNESSISLSASTDAASSGHSMSLRNYRYQSGKGQFVEITSRCTTPSVNNIKRWGLFDSQDGLFFSTSGTDFGVVQRSSTAGSMAEFFIPQSEFNLDKIDGTGKSGFNIDLTKGNIFWMSFQWLAVGAVLYGTVDGAGELIPVHINMNANSNEGPYMATANLPVRYDIENTGAVSTTSNLIAICQTVQSEGGEDPPTAENAAINSDFITTTNNDEIPILSIRCKTALNGIRSKIETIPSFLTLATETRAMLFRIRKNGTLTSPTWQEADDTHSSIEWDENASAITDGRILGAKVLAADESGDFDLSKIFDANKEYLSYNNNDLQEILTITMQRTANQNGGGLASLNWGEIR
jgi:hypothetical protein